MKNKTIAVMLAGLMVALTACGNSSDDTSSSSESKAAASTTSSTAESSEVSSVADESSDSDSESTAETASKTDDTESSAADESKADEAESTGGNVLVAYFSNIQTDSTDANVSASRLYRNGDMVGVTEYGAQIIAEHTGGDLFFIKGNDYPADYDSTTQVAREEQQENARPQLVNHIDNIDDYDVVFVCYPTWWTDMPMAVYSFFDEYDLSGKTIIPFNTHWGYGAADTYQTIAQLEPNADVKDGLSLYNYDMESSESTITDWIDGLEI